MSFFQTRTQVRQVAPVVPTNAMIAARLIAEMLPQLGSAAKAALAKVSERTSQTLVLAPVPDFRKSAALPESVKSLDQAKTATFAEIAWASLLVEHPAVLKQGLSAVARSRTLQEALRSRAKLRETLTAGHRRLFLDSIRQACKAAAVQTGFSTVKEQTGALGETRVSATDAQGRGILTEIRTDRAGELVLESEVVGVSDGSCQEVLEGFDEALQAQGIRSRATHRRPTNGRSELRAVREFLQKNVESAKRRAQRLNNRVTGRVRG